MKNETNLPAHTPGTSRDAFLGGRISVLQPVKGFRSGLDAVFLAAACPANPDERVLEAGCSTGVAALCLCACVPGLQITGIETDSGLAELAVANAIANGFGEAIDIVTADVMSPWTELEQLGLAQNSFDRVMANPPFYAEGEVRAAPEARRSGALAMGKGSLDRWLRFLAAACKPGGSCTIIHRTAALPELLDAFAGRFGELRVLPLYPKKSADALRVIVTGHKGSRGPLSFAPGIVLHEEDGRQTEIANAVLRQGLRLA